MELEKEVIDIVKSNISYNGEININSSLGDDLDIGSFDKLMIINAIEDNYSIKLNESVLAKIDCIKDLVEIVREYIKP